MRFRPAIFIFFAFAQSFFKFHKNDDNRKLKAWSFRLRKNDFCKLYNERAKALQSSITFFLIHPEQVGILSEHALEFARFTEKRLGTSKFSNSIFGGFRWFLDGPRFFFQPSFY